MTPVNYILANTSTDLSNRILESHTKIILCEENSLVHYITFNCINWKFA